MGKSGVEPNDPHPAVNAMWLNQPDRIASAKHEAYNARVNGDHACVHSIMLSAYYTALSGNPAEGRHSVKFFLLALWHTFCLLRRWRELNHNQLDVLVAFLIKLRKKKIPAWPFRPDLIDLSGREVELVEANSEAKPHQIALAYLTRAETIRIQWGNRPSTIWNFVTKALSFESAIRAESDQPQGLRQFVRILRKAGELYGEDEMSAGEYYTQKAKGYLNRALDLARGEADAPDQVPKIQASLRKII